MSKKEKKAWFVIEVVGEYPMLGCFYFNYEEACDYAKKVCEFYKMNNLGEAGFVPVRISQKEADKLKEFKLLKDDDGTIIAYMEALIEKYAERAA